MNKKINHRPFILTGCLLWMASFFGEALSFQPYSTVGIVISPILTGFGIYHWFRFYKSTRGHNPKFGATLKTMTSKAKNPFVGMSFMFSHILEFWTFIIVTMMIMVGFGFWTFGQSDAFLATKNYCESDLSILAQTGNIKYYGVLVGGKISTKLGGESGNAQLSFTIVGQKGNFTASSMVRKSEGTWIVKSVKFN